MMALNAYRNAERMMASAYPGCGISWNLLAGIGRIESMHANGGATDAAGSAVRPIYGPALDGTLPGNETIELSRSSSRVVYARAMGPMQFLPGTWSRYASDGNGDGKADVQNVFDSTLAAARYLCSGGLNLRDQSQVMTAILRYNNSMAYAQNVLGWAAAYATGVVPVDLPPITGPIPPIADVHLDNYQGLGPGLADERPRAARQRPACRGAAVRPGPHGCGEPDGERADVRAAAGTGGRGPADDDAAGAGTEPAALDAAVDAAVDAAAAGCSRRRSSSRTARCSALARTHRPRCSRSCRPRRCRRVSSPAGRAGRASRRPRWPESRRRRRHGEAPPAPVRPADSDPKASDRRPARPPDRSRARGANRLDRRPPTLGGDVRTSH